MKVLIVDSSEEILTRLKEMLSELPTVTTVYQAKSCSTAVHAVKKNMPDIVILDVNLHTHNSIDCAKKIMKLAEHVTIISLASNAEKMEDLQNRLHFAEYIFDKYHEFEKIPATIKLIAKSKKIKGRMNG